jgi:putative transposase
MWAEMGTWFQIDIRMHGKMVCEREIHQPCTRERIMPGPRPPMIELSKPARRDLERLLNAHKTDQQIALRGRIILEAGAGKGNAEIARAQAISVSMVRLWRQRWLDLQALPLSELDVKERLEDLPRPGAPPRITADQICQIVALACEEPEKSGRPISHWTGREIADELVKAGVVETISPRHARRLLKRSYAQTPSDSLLVNS